MLKDVKKVELMKVGFNKGKKYREYKRLTQEQKDNSKLNEVCNIHINIGTGKDISIKDLAYLIKDIIGYKGEFYFNTLKPDGTMRKVTDVSKLHSLGWKHKIELEYGIKKIFEWYVKSK